MERQRECPICRAKIRQLNSKHIKKCFNKDLSYKYQYIIHNFPELDKNKINELYNINKWSMNMIRDKYKIDLKSIDYLINYYGFKTRTISESHRLNEYKERIESTNLKKYGAINPLSKGTIPFKKRNKTVKDRYGCENVFQVIGEFIDNWKPFKSNSMVSSLNKSLYVILDKLNVEYQSEFSIKYVDDTGKTRSKIFDAKIGNLLIEANGDYWHANPIKYKATDIFNFPKSTLTAQDIWNIDIYKKEIAESSGYSVMYIWESEFNNIENVTEKIKDQINKTNQ